MKDQAVDEREDRRQAEKTKDQSEKKDESRQTGYPNARGRVSGRKDRGHHIPLQGRIQAMI